MLLRWKTECLKVVELIPTKKTEDVVITRPSIVLLPGVNEVTDDEWKVMEAHLSDALAQGTLEIISTKVRNGPGKTKEVHNLKDMPINRALDLVRKTNNPETLQKWEQDEIRPEVRLAVTKQMDKLKVEPEEKSLAYDLDESPSSSDDKENA